MSRAPTDAERPTAASILTRLDAIERREDTDAATLGLRPLPPAKAEQMRPAGSRLRRLDAQDHRGGPRPRRGSRGDPAADHAA